MAQRAASGNPDEVQRWLGALPSHGVRLYRRLADVPLEQSDILWIRGAADEGPRYEMLSGPRGVADDLKKLAHVSPTIEKKLNDDLGIFHFWQIAALGPEAAHKIGEEVGLPGRVEGWIAQSKELSAE